MPDFSYADHAHRFWQDGFFDRFRLGRTLIIAAPEPGSFKMADRSLAASYDTDVAGGINHPGIARVE